MPPSVIALLSAAPDIRTEVMSPFFRKIHLRDGRALHHFTAADEGDEFHDHPWSFTSEVLHGGYEEEAIELAWPGWKARWRIRNVGDVFGVPANHTHRITRLLYPDCWTLVTAGPVERDVRFYRFRDGQVQSRLWNEGWPA